jgi:hypothetical protein
MEISIKLPDPLQIVREGLLEELINTARFSSDWVMSNKELPDDVRELVHYTAVTAVSNVLDVLDGNTDQGRYILLPMSVVTDFTNDVPTMTGNLSEAFYDLYERINN